MGYRLVASALALALSASVHAQVHKCTMPDGKVEYTNSPCAAGTQRTVSIVENAPMSGAVFRAEARRLRVRDATLRAEDDAIQAGRNAIVAAAAAERRAASEQKVAAKKAAAERAAANKPIICRSSGTALGIGGGMAVTNSTSVCR